MAKILLISANKLREPYPVYPIGVSYLSTYLKQSLPDSEVTVFDMNFGTPDDLSQTVEQSNPDYIGISLRNIDGANSFDRTSFVSQYESLMKIVRSRSNAKIIIGGAGFSIYSESLFELLSPDFAIKGEGEKALTELLSALESESDHSKIEGLMYKNSEGKIISNRHNEFATKLSVEFDNRLIDYYWQKSGMLNIQTKRGCPYNCIYCSYPLIEGRKIRTLQPEEIVDNLEKLSKEYGINYVFFTDSVFNIAKAQNIELAELIIRRGLKISWAAYFSPSNLTDDELAIYKQSGLTHIEFGTESFSDEQLSNYGKNFNFDDVLKTSESALKNNIFYAHFLILGGYGETDGTISETFENSKRLRYTVMFPFVGMRIYPGTPLQQRAVDEGLITPDNNLLEPVYYVSDKFDGSTLKEQAAATGKAWIFPDDLSEKDIERFRIKRKKKGLIWEYLRKP